MKKAIFIGTALLILVFEGHLVLEILLHIVETLLEILELLVDTFMEFMGLDLYESQKATAWLGFAVFSILAVEGLKRLMVWVQETRGKVDLWWAEEKVILKANRWRLAAVGIAVLLVLLLLV